MRRVVLSRRAERDLPRIGAGETLARIREALAALAGGEADLDVTPLVESAPWHRLRVGDYRILYRPVAPSEEAEAGAEWLVARVIQRRDLERAVATLI